MSQVAIYCRLSDEDRNKQNANDESESIQNQKLLLTQYAAEKGWHIYKIYVDEDYSGLDKDRPRFNQMIKDAENRMFSIILCKHQSRFSRDIETIERYLHNKFIEWDIRFVSLTDNVDTLQKGGKKSRQINSLVNEWYCEDISEAIKASFSVKRQNGKFIGSFAAYGYKKDSCDKNKLIVDEYASNVIKMIYGWYIEGYGVQRIANMLNENSISSPSRYKQNNGLKYNNALIKNEYVIWNKTTVKRILKNEMYIGNMVQGIRRKVSYKSNKFVAVPKNEWVIVEGTHQPIIDKNDFCEVQRRLKFRTRSCTEGKIHVFSSKLRCMSCGSTMNKADAGNGYIYLRCRQSTLDPSKKACTSHSIRLDHLTEAVAATLREHARNYCNADDLTCRIKKNYGKQHETSLLRKELLNINKELETLKEITANLYRDKVSGLFSEDQFYELYNRYSMEKENYIAEKKSLEHELSCIYAGKYDMDSCTDIINRYIDFKELTNIIVAETIEFIEIGAKDPKTGNQQIKIHWMF